MYNITNDFKSDFEFRVTQRFSKKFAFIPRLWTYPNSTHIPSCIDLILEVYYRINITILFKGRNKIIGKEVILIFVHTNIGIISIYLQYISSKCMDKVDLNEVSTYKKIFFKPKTL